MSKEDLIHIKKHNGDDISHYKIYFNEHVKQYKHMFKCAVCDTNIECNCWDDLDTAIGDIDRMSIFCNRHWLESEFADCFPEMCELVDRIAGTNTKRIADIYEMVQCGELYPKATCEYMEQRESELRQQAVDILKTLTDKQVDKITSEMDCDCDDFSGHSCGM